jgi:hypothetical protein
MDDNSRFSCKTCHDISCKGPDVLYSALITAVIQGCGACSIILEGIQLYIKEWLPESTPKSVKIEPTHTDQIPFARKKTCNVVSVAVSMRGAAMVQFIEFYIIEGGRFQSQNLISLLFDKLIIIRVYLSMEHP